MATRTAPTVDGSPNVTNVTLHLVDTSGDTFTDQLPVFGTPTAADYEAWAASYQAATQASLWKVSIGQEYVGDADPDNADAGFRGSISDGINLLYKNIATRNSVTPRLVAPISAVMQGNQDIPLISSAELTALITAELAILTGYGLSTAQFTGRRERTNNPKIKV